MNRSYRAVPWLFLPVLLLLTGCAPGNLIDMMRYPFSHGLFSLILLVLDIIALVELAKSSKEPLHKALWALVIILFPFVGLLLYYFIGRESS